MAPSFYKPLSMVAGLGASLLAGGWAYERVSANRERTKYPGPGQFVDVGNRLYVRVEHSDVDRGPAVIFESGMGSQLECWVWVQRQLRGFATSVSYDRACTGRSEWVREPLTAARNTAELRTMLKTIGLPGPYVLVAHSFGGLLALYFAQQHPDEVAGLVLADCSHPDELARSPRQMAGLENLETLLRDRLQQSRWGVFRLHVQPEDLGLDMLPADERDSAMVPYRTARTWAGALAEFRAWQSHVSAEVQIRQLERHVPVIVLTAGQVISDDPVHLDLQEELVALSDNSDHRIVEDAGHLSLILQRDYADQVSRAVRDVHEAAQGNGNLRCRDAPKATTGRRVV